MDVWLLNSVCEVTPYAIEDIHAMHALLREITESDPGGEYVFRIEASYGVDDLPCLIIATDYSRRREEIKPR
jgi:hypothetical protein